MNQESQQVKKVLSKVKEVLTRSVWGKGSLRSRDGEHMCLLGAVAQVESFVGDNDDLYNQLDKSPVVKALANQIGPAPRIPATSVVYHFNDHPDRSYDEVQELLDDTIAAQGS